MSYAIRYQTLKYARQLYAQLPQRWFRAFFGYNDVPWDKFYAWTLRIKFTLTFENMIIFCCDSEAFHEVSAHFAFLDGRLSAQQENFEEALKFFWTAGYVRLEVQVLQWAGHSIRKWLKNFGFELEGTMRKKHYYAGTLGGQPLLCDLEVWALLRKEPENV